MILGTYLINDLHRLNKTEILKKVKESTRFSFSFITLLVGSSIVCSLGLLLDSTAVVIGGMIISPLMWPLMHTSLGISYGRPEYIRRALLVLTIASAVGLWTAFLITLFSPIKIITNEVLARTTPTLIDIVIAFVAGAVAALAISQPKVSESLAGVAIAASLMPPLCVSGIGLALLNFPVFWSGLLLYLTNIVSIIFISILFFIWVGVKKDTEQEVQRKGLGITAFILLIMAIPLFLLLRDYTFEAEAYTKVESTLRRDIGELHPDVFISNVKVTTNTESKDLVYVAAEVLVPEGLSINYEDRQYLIDSLEKVLDKDVNLVLQVQKSLSILSQNDIEQRSTQEFISSLFVSKLKEMQPEITVDSLQVVHDSNTNSWNVNSVLHGDPSTVFTFEEQHQIKESLESSVNETVDLNIEIISRVKIQTKPEELNLRIKQAINDYFLSLSNEIVITSISISSEIASIPLNPLDVVSEGGTLPLVDSVDSKDMLRIKINIQVPESLLIDNVNKLELEDLLTKSFSKQFDVKINYTKITILE